MRHYHISCESSCWSGRRTTQYAPHQQNEITKFRQVLQHNPIGRRQLSPAQLDPYSPAAHTVAEPYARCASRWHTSSAPPRSAPLNAPRAKGSEHYNYCHRLFAFETGRFHLIGFWVGILCLSSSQTTRSGFIFQ